MSSGSDKYEDKNLLSIDKQIDANPNNSNLYYKRGNIFRDLGEKEKAIADYTMVIKLKSDYTDAYINRGNCFSELGEEEKAIADYTKAIEQKPDYALAYYNRGISLGDIGEKEKAIADYTKAIELKPDHALAYYNRGIRLGELGEKEKAIADYTKAIELKPDYANAYNNRGNCFSDIGEKEKAIADYTKAIELKPDNEIAYNNRGNRYRDIGEKEKAIADYTKAIELKPDFALACSNYGFLLKDLAMYEDAKTMLLQAQKLYKGDNNSFYLNKIDKVMLELDEYINVSVKNKSGIADEDLFAKVTEYTKDIYSISNAKKNSFLSFLKPRKDIKRSNYLEVLRRWNSYTPIVADNYHISKGGGYFIQINGKGIVIDPGFNFIENFKGQDHLFDEIDILLISHSHNDHTADIESILTLLHKYNENIKISDNPEIDTIEKDVIVKFGEEWEKLSEKEKKSAIEEAFIISSKRKVIDIYMTTSTFKKYSGMFDLFDKVNYSIHIIEDGYKKNIDNIEVSAIKAKHFDIISDNSAVGFMISFDDYVFVYTGDTGINEDIAEQYKKIADNLGENKYIVLLAHIGGFKDYESKYEKDKIKYEYFYENHIGRLGLVELNSIIKPDICLISEFGEEFKESRIKIAEVYNELFKNEVTFLPADIGLKLFFSGQGCKIEAVKDLIIEDYKTVKGHFLPEEIKVCLLRKDYSLHYYSQNKQNFTEGDLIQVLIEEYELNNR